MQPFDVAICVAADDSAARYDTVHAALPQHIFREAERRRRERARRRAGDQRDEEQRRHRQPEAQPESVDIGQHVGLALHPRRQRSQRPRRRGARAMAGKIIARAA